MRRLPVEKIRGGFVGGISAEEKRRCEPVEQGVRPR
jgi:hypothetical protein